MELAIASRQHTVSHFLFHQGIFTNNNMTLVPNSSYFDTIEVIEAESQAALNILTEDDFQDAFKKWQKRWERLIGAEGEYFEGDGGQ
jgi:hypothetical protein